MKCVLTAFGVLFVGSVAAALSFGGISGGGGNVLAPIPPVYDQDPHQVKMEIENSRTELVHFLRTKQDQMASGQMPFEEQSLYAPIFSGDHNIFTQVSYVPLHVEVGHSCLTSDDNPVDGSILDDENGTVCISAYNLAHKVRAQDIRSQATALMLHEYSELTGANEDQAVRLQTSALHELISNSSVR